MFSLIVQIIKTLAALGKDLAKIKLSQDEIKASQEQQRIQIQRLMEKLAQVIDLLSSGPAIGFIFTAVLDGKVIVGVEAMDITDVQEVDLSITPVDKRGNPAQLDGIPEWASSNSEVVSVAAAADGLSAVAKAVGPLGSATVSVKADGDLGDGVNNISGTLDITVTGSGAVNLTIKAGSPRDQA